MKKVLLAFTKNAIPFDKDRQLDCYSRNGWDIYEANCNTNIQIARQFAEYASEKGFEELLILTEGHSDVDGVILSECNRAINTSVELMSYERLEENSTKYIPPSDNPDITNPFMQGQKNIYIGLLVNPQIAGRFSQIKRLLMDFAMKFLATFTSIVREEFRAALIEDLKLNPALGNYAPLINSQSTFIRPKIIIVDGDKDMGNLCQPFSGKEFFDMVWGKYDTATEESFKVSSASRMYINMQSPNNFFLNLSSENKNPNMIILYNMNPNIGGEYKWFEEQHPIYVVNDKSLNVTNFQFPNTLAVYRKYLNGFDDSMFTTSVIKQHNTGLMKIAKAISTDIMSKNYKPAHDAVANSDIEESTMINPFANFLYGMTKFSGDLSLSNKEKIARNPAKSQGKKDGLLKGLSIVVDSFGKTYNTPVLNDIASAMAKVGTINTEEAKNNEKLLQQHGIDPSKNVALKLHKDFPQALSICFDKSEVSMKYK